MQSSIMFVCKTWAMLAIVLFHYVRHLVPDSWRWSLVVMAWGIMAHVFFFISWWWQFLSYERWQQKKPWRGWTGLWFVWVIKKVYLPYIAVICSIGLIWWLFPHVFPPQSRSAFFSHILGYKMFDAWLLTSFGDHFWFLSPLLSLYVLTPLFVLLIKNHPRTTLVWSCVISLGYWVLLVVADLFWWRHRQVAFPSFLWQYILWMALAFRWWMPEHARTFVVSWRGAMLGTFLVCCYGWLSIWGGEMGRVMNDRCALPLVMMCCILCAQRERWKRVAVRWSGVSYYIFLIHGIWFMLWKWLMGWDVTILMILGAFVSLLGVWCLMAWYQHRVLP